jgi:predicted ABC-type ATPase/GNAT superfamily N-acetyltransferase
MDHKQFISIEIKLEAFKIWFKEEIVKVNLEFEDEFISLIYETFFCGLSSQNEPKILMLGGSPGAGKTTYRKKYLNDSAYHIHDMDEVMVLLPGYQQALKTVGAIKAFEDWWPIAQQTANIMMTYALNNKLNIIYDRTCGSEVSYLALKAAYEQGYQITMYGFYIEEKKALERVQIRAKNENRVITDDIVKDYLRRFVTLWPCYLKIVDKVFLVDSNEETYKLIFNINNKKITFADYTAYKKFLSSGYDVEQAKEKFPNILVVLDDIKLKNYQEKKARLGLCYLTMNSFQSPLKISKLSENSPWLEQIAFWIEEKWGYIRNFPGISVRKELISKALKVGDFYVLAYENRPVGMFALFNYDNKYYANKKIAAKELMYVYVDECFRGLGIGRKIIEAAKKIAYNQGAKTLILDTLNPNLNKFYEKQGAHEICESTLLNHPTTLFRLGRK